MEIILLEDLEGVGEKGAVVSVKPGYARNYLLPRKLAIPAGTNAANLFKELQRQHVLQEDRRVAVAREAAARLNGVEVNIPAPANEEDTLFGSVTEGDIADALARAGHPVDKHKIRLEEHIKQLGLYDVVVGIHGDVSATVKVWVVRP
jgi:large subunit ribosomal protein L9